MDKTDVLRKPEEHLVGEQKKVYRLDTNGTVLVKGGAGSGKTLVAIARARFLSQFSQNLFGPTKIGFFTYDKSLRDEVASYLHGSEIEVTNIDRWVYHFLRRRGVPIGRLPDKETRSDFNWCLSRARQEAFKGQTDKAITTKSADFYKDEIAWMKGRIIEDEETYLNTPRTGRGTADRVTAEDRHLLWKLRICFDNFADERGLEMFEDLVNAAIKNIQHSPLEPDEYFTHVIIDEAQDFTLAKLRLISMIAAGVEGIKSITLFADAAQKIYQSGFSWKDANISVRGARSYEFKRNYRNTLQIAKAAVSLLSHEEDRSELVDMELPTKEGPKPILLRGGQDELIAEIVDRTRKAKVGEKIVVTAYGNSDILLIKTLLEGSGIQADLRGATNMVHFNPQNRPIVYLRTFHKMKGLQFDHVYIWGMEEKRFPPAEDVDKDISRFRMLLYVAMTRACETLTICYSREPSRFIGDISPDLVETREAAFK